jgi:hypothetical protein
MFMKKLILILTLMLACIMGSWAAQRDTVKILAIGNSFSEDAVEEHLSGLVRAEGLNVIICNMYIGGCSIDRHVKNLRGNLPKYRYRKIGVDGKMMEVKGYSLEKVLAEEDWDYVSVQQSSPVSGLPDSYALLPELVEFVKSRVPEGAVIMFHQTWAYSPDSNHKGFVNYDKDQMKMYNAIVSTVNQEAPKAGIKKIIPSGTAIQNARTSHLGDDLTRDGYHLSRPLGRYIASCTWLEEVLGVNPVGNSYCPDGMTLKECRTAQKAAHKAVKRPSTVTRIR